MTVYKVLLCLALPRVNALGDYKPDVETCSTLVPLQLNKTNTAGSLLPLPALLGAAASAALLWTENHRWIYSPFASVPIIIGLVSTLLVHDALAARCKGSPRAQVHATTTRTPTDGRVSV